MAKRKTHFTDILIRQGIISPDQVAEAEQLARQSNT
jgi:hypothetical protein